MKSNVMFILENGEPYEPNIEISVETNPLLIGRLSNAFKPDICFSNLHISRRHASLTCECGIFKLIDLGSKHGTNINGERLVPGTTYELHDGDRIVLANGVVSLWFCDNRDDDVTIDFDSTYDSERSFVSSLKVNVERRELLIDGIEASLYGKEMDLLLCLYNNKNRVLSYDEIRQAVWPERGKDGFVDVNNNEITTLVHRTRKKLGSHGKSIVSIPRFGYRLDL